MVSILEIRLITRMLNLFMALYWRESGSKFVSNFQFLGFLVAIKHIFNDVINVD